MNTSLIIRIVVAGGLIAAMNRSQAQDPLPPPPPVPPPPKWEASLALGFTLTKGNSDTVLGTINGQAQKKTPKHEIAFGADGAYGENDSERNTAFIHGFFQYNYLFTDRFYGYARVDALHDDISDVYYRVTLSPGVGYYFIKEKRTTLAGEIGPGLVTENQSGDYNTYATLRIAERFEHKFKNEARIWQSIEFLPELGHFHNYIINAEIGVDAPLSKKLFLTAYIQDTYDNEIPQGPRRNNDLKLVSGLKYKF